MSPVDTAVPFRRLAAAVSGLLLTVAGCTLFSSADLTTAMTTQRPVLPPIQAPSDAVQLQVVFIERPIDDPLVSQLVWQQLDQVGAIPPDTREVLTANGFRIGQTGARPPAAVQKLLGLTEEVLAGGDEDRIMMRGRRMGLRSAQETEIQTLDGFMDGTVTYQIGTHPETAEYQQSRSILKVRPVRVQDGWVRMDFTPEIHHGEARMRHTPTDDGWALRGGQKCDVRHALKFHVMLNDGEIAVISGDASRPDSAGYRFFCQESDGRKSQRVLIVRLADAGRSEDVLALK